MSTGRENGPYLDVQNLTIRRDGRILLDGVSFSLGKGEVLTVIGPNGAGKSTLLKAVCGLLSPWQGTITCGTRKIGYVPQAFIPDTILPMTAGRFLSLNGGGNIEEAAEEFSLSTKLLSTPLTELSGGERQKILLVRALSRKPELLVLDEPDQALDIGGQEKFYALLEEAREKYGHTILMSSHNLFRVMRQTSQVICLNRHICCSGRPDAIRDEPAYLALFGGAAALYTHRHNHEHDF